MPERTSLKLKIAALSVILLAVSVPLSAQSPRSVARKFTKEIQQNHKTILITEPAFLYKYNLKYQNAKLTRAEQDSIAWEKSDFVKNITDSIFMHFFVEGYMDQLKKFGLQPFLKKMPIPSRKPDFYADIVQAELEEQYYPYTDTAYLDNKPYIFRKNLNAVDVSFWFKVFPAAMAVPKEEKVYFAENLLVDNMEGGFSMNEKGTLVYFYKINKLTISKIYTYADGLGRTYADFTFDQLLNQYLQKEVPASKLEGKYWHYDPVYNKLYTGEDYKFIELK